MRMPCDFPLGQLSSPTAGIFPGQTPAMDVYSSTGTAALGFYVLRMSSYSAGHVWDWCETCNSAWSVECMHDCVLLWLMQSRYDTFFSQVTAPTVAIDSRWQGQESQTTVKPHINLMYLCCSLSPYSHTLVVLMEKKTLIWSYQGCWKEFLELHFHSTVYFLLICRQRAYVHIAFFVEPPAFLYYFQWGASTEKNCCSQCLLSEHFWLKISQLFKKAFVASPVKR